MNGHYASTTHKQILMRKRLCRGEASNITCFLAYFHGMSAATPTHAKISQGSALHGMHNMHSLLRRENVWLVLRSAWRRRASGAMCLCFTLRIRRGAARADFCYTLTHANIPLIHFQSFLHIQSAL